MRVSLPHDWKPRPWQRDVLRARERGIARGCIAVHRRAGKTDLLLNMAAIEAHKRVGSYIHVFPTNVQGRKAIWRGIDGKGRRFVDRVFPDAICRQKREQEMQIDFLNGSSWQLLGADEPGNLVGINPVGVVVDEYALHDGPEVLDYLRPILAENGGWLYVCSTFRGRNHMFDLYHNVKGNPDWYAAHLDADETHENDGTPLISAEDIEAERKGGMSEEMIRQEFYLDTTAAFSGAYYAHGMGKMRDEARLGDFPYDASRPVHVAFDLGFADLTVAVLFQTSEPERTTVVGSHAWQFTPFSEICAHIKRRFPWTLQTAVFPFDARRPGPAGDTIAATAEAFRLADEVIVLPKGNGLLHAGIALVQQKLASTSIDDRPRAWSDGKPNNSRLIDALCEYRTEKKSANAFTKAPHHDWTSHWADALRYMLIYRHGDMSTGWGPAPSTVAADRAHGWGRPAYG